MSLPCCCATPAAVGDYRGLWFLPHLLLRKLAVAIGLLDASVRRWPSAPMHACGPGIVASWRAVGRHSARLACFAGRCVPLNLAPPAPFAPPQNGTGTGNTALATHAGRLLALHEGDLPYALRIACSGLVDTIGRASFG